MARYVCTECNSVFEEPKEFIEQHDLSTPPYERYHGCPRCGGSYDDAVECVICGRVVPESEAVTLKADNVKNISYIPRDVSVCLSCAHHIEVKFSE